MNRTSISSAFILLAAGLAAVRADTFTYVNENGAEVTIDARLIGSGRGFQALERGDGQIQIVSTGAIRSRQPNDGPEPIDFGGMADLLKRRFGEDLVRIETQRPFLIAMVLSSPLEKSAEPRAAAFVKKAARFMGTVDSVFLRFARSMRFPLQEPRFPLVLLIFESDDDFNRYTAEVTGGQGLSASSIAGFYFSLTNWLAVRMSSCDTFEVPLHEAIHLQMYNRVFQRLTPIPKWFDEGIAAGFEGNGERIDVSPARINSRYARQAMRLSGGLTWQDVIADDSAFTADVLAGEAYTLAWCMHWMLATQHKDSYREYVQELSRLEPLSTVDAGNRIENFQKVFGVSAGDLQVDFSRVFESNLKRQKINLSPPEMPGQAKQQQALGELQINAVQRADLAGQLQVEGTLRNISPLRSMTYYVAVVADSGTYADWVIADLKPGQSRKLDRQTAVKVVPGSRGIGGNGTFRMSIRSTPADSRESDAWRSGNPPGPAANAGN